MVMTAKQRAGKARADKANMENAARNVRICELDADGHTKPEIQDTVGVSDYVVRSVLKQGLDHWRGWLEKARDAGLVKTDGFDELVEREEAGASHAEAQGALMMVDVWEIEDNPWQPRSLRSDQDYRENKIDDLMLDVYSNGLNQAIGVREKDGAYQLVYGQRRLEAFKQWDYVDWKLEQIDAEYEADGTWAERYFVNGITLIPAVCKIMTDDEAIIATFSENAQREELNWLDETRAAARALETDERLTQSRLAGALGVSPANLSQRLKMLRLPDGILDFVGSGILPWTAAREAMAYVGTDHIHEYELEYVVKSLTGMLRNESRRGRLSREDVHTAMANAMGTKGNHAKWEYFGDDNFVWLGGNYRKYRPRFDIQKFQDEHFDSLHMLPAQYSHNMALWTCRGDVWREWQERAEIEESKRKAAMLDPLAAQSATGEVRREAAFFDPEINESTDQDVIDAPINFSEPDAETGDDQPERVSTGKSEPANGTSEGCPDSEYGIHRYGNDMRCQGCGIEIKDNGRSIRPPNAETTEPATQVSIRFSRDEGDAIRNARDALTDIYMGVLDARQTPVAPDDLSNCRQLVGNVFDVLTRMETELPDDAA